MVPPTTPLPGGAGGDVVAPDHGGVSAGEHPAQLSGLAVSVARPGQED